MVEQWRDIDGYEGFYQVSSLGRVKSLKRMRVPAERYLTPSPLKNGYLNVRLLLGGKSRAFYVHRLVAAAFLGDLADDMTVNHKDGDKTNNAVDNLEIISRGENIRHAIATGLMDHGKLNRRNVDEILVLKDKMSSRRVAEMYNVSHTNVLAIWRGEIWQDEHSQYGGQSMVSNNGDLVMPDAPPAKGRLYVDLETLILWKANYNQGDVGGIMRSVLEFGYNRSISVWQDNVVVAGNHTMLALKWIKRDGYFPRKYAPENCDPDKIFDDGNGIIIDDQGVWFVLISDCSHLTYQKAVAYAVADNEWARRAVRDESLLLKHLKDTRDYAAEIGSESLQDATGFDNDELELLAKIVGDDQHKSLDELGEDYDETDADGDALTNSLTTQPIIRVQVDHDTFARYHELMDGASEKDHGARLGEILRAVDPATLSWGEG